MDEHTQLAMALSISLVDESQDQRCIVTDLPIEDVAPKPRKRGKKKKKTDEDLDEQTRIAMAISASLADETKQKNKDLGKKEEKAGKKPRAKAKGKAKKVRQEYPVLLLRTDSERKKILSERFSELLESFPDECLISDHVFQPSSIRMKYSDPDRRLLTDKYPGNIKVKSEPQLWTATGADLSKKKTGKLSPFYVEELKPTIVPLTPKKCTSPSSHQASSETLIETPDKQNLSKSASTAPNESSIEESMSMTQSLGMTVQCLAELAEEGFQDSLSHSSSDKCGFIPQDIAQREDSPESRLSDDQLTLLEELSSLVNSSTMSDAIIQINDGSKLHVHTFLIQLRCPALATLFAMSSNRNGTSLPCVVVNDMSYEAMENVLSYIYSANINITSETAAEINTFAERFNMTELASHCKPHLQDDVESNETSKKRELDIVDKDLNQLIDSLWEDEDNEEDQKEKFNTTVRTSDDEVNETLNDDEIKEIRDIALSQRLESESDLTDVESILSVELACPILSSPKETETDGMKDDEEEEEVWGMMLTQRGRRSNTGSYCSQGNRTDEDDNEDWSMALDDGVMFPDDKASSPNAATSLNPSNRRGDSSSSNNDTITNKSNHELFDESNNSLLNHTLVSEGNQAVSGADQYPKTKISSTLVNIPKDSEKNGDRYDQPKVLYESLDDGVAPPESPEDEVLFLHSDSPSSHDDKKSRQLRKGQPTKKTSRSLDKNLNVNALKRKKLLVQANSAQTDSDTSPSPPDLTGSCHEDEVQTIETREKRSLDVFDKTPHSPSIISKTSECSNLNKNGNTKKKSSSSQSSLTNNYNDPTSFNRLDSCDGSLSEDILSPSPPPSPKFKRASQIPRLEKMVTDQSSISKNSFSNWNRDRSLKMVEKRKNNKNEEDPYELSQSSSTSSGNECKQQPPSKRKKQKRKKQTIPKSSISNNFTSSCHESSSSSKITKRKWSSLRSDHDHPTPRSRYSNQIERNVVLSCDKSLSAASAEQACRTSVSPMSISSASLDSLTPRLAKIQHEQSYNKSASPHSPIQAHRTSSSPLSHTSPVSCLRRHSMSPLTSSFIKDHTISPSPNPLSRPSASIVSPLSRHSKAQVESPFNMSLSPRSSVQACMKSRSPPPVSRSAASLDSPTLRQSNKHEAQLEQAYELSPSPPMTLQARRISLSPSPSPDSQIPPASRASPALPGASLSKRLSFDASVKESTCSPVQDADETPEERFAFDMEEGFGYDDFNAGMDQQDDYDDDDTVIGNVGENVMGEVKELHRSERQRENSVIQNGINQHFEEENEVNFPIVEIKRENVEEGLTDDTSHHSPSFRGLNSCDDGGHYGGISTNKQEHNSLGTPHVTHSKDSHGGGPMNCTRGNRKLSQSSRTTPKTSQSASAPVLRTPSVSRLIEDEYYPPAPITPMPDYNSMLTPELKKELKRYGVKPLGKKKSKLLLAEIFSYLHQVMPEDQSDDDTSSTARPDPEPPKGRAKKGKTSKPKQTSKKNQTQKKPKEESSSDDRPAKQNKRTKGATKKVTKPKKRKEADGGLDETPTKRVKMECHDDGGENDMDFARRGLEMEERTGLEEFASSQDSHSSSFDSNRSDFGESMYHEELEEDDDIMATQDVQDMATELTRYITRNKELHQKILQYEVLHLEEFYKELKEAKLKCSKPKLMEFLDQRCITYRHKGGSRQRKPKNTKTKK